MTYGIIAGTACRTLLGSDCCWGAFRNEPSNAPDLSTHSSKFFFDALVAAINVIDAVDDGFAGSDETGKNQASGGTQVGGLDR